MQVTSHAEDMTTEPTTPSCARGHTHSHAGSDTTLGRVRDLIPAAEKTRLPIVRIIDEYLGYYTPLVLAIGGSVWVLAHDLNRVVAIIIVSCPCAFVLASPTAMVAALSAAARLGILIKNVADLELAARINAFVFDNTGTPTTGRLVVRRLMPLDATTPAELLGVAASAERFSNHPTARALVQLAREAGVPLDPPTDFAETAGRGISPIVAALLHVSGALLVAFNSFRLMRQGEELEPGPSGTAAAAAPSTDPALTMQPADAHA